MKSDRRSRFIRLTISLMFIGFFGFIVHAIARNEMLNPSLFVGIYVAYLVLQGTLLSLLCARLFSHHEMKAFRFDVGSIILITLIVSVPLSILSCLEIRNTGFYEILAVCLYFQILPVFLTLEALAYYHHRIRRQAELPNQNLNVNQSETQQ